MGKGVVWNIVRNECGNGSYSYDSENKLVTVVSQHGKKSTQLGGLPLEYLVGLLMRELAAEHRRETKD